MSEKMLPAKILSSTELGVNLENMLRVMVLEVKRIMLKHICHPEQCIVQGKHRKE